MAHKFSIGQTVYYQSPAEGELCGVVQSFDLSGIPSSPFWYFVNITTKTKLNRNWADDVRLLNQDWLRSA